MTDRYEDPDGYPPSAWDTSTDYGPRGQATPPRSTDPRTSFAAAESVSSSTIMRTYRAILTIVSRSPATLEEMVDFIQSKGFGSPSGTRTRCSVLVDHGYVVDSGVRKVGSTNRLMILWAITDKGRKLVEEMWAK